MRGKSQQRRQGKSEKASRLSGDAPADLNAASATIYKTCEKGSGRYTPNCLVLRRILGLSMGDTTGDH